MIWILLGFHLVGVVGYSLLLRRQAYQKTLHPWVLATVLQTATFVIPLIIALFIHPDLTKFTLLDGVVVVLAALLSITLYISGVKALQNLEASSYAVVYSGRVIVATLLGVMFLTEQPAPLQVVGGLCILTAIMVLKQRGERSASSRGIAWAIMAAVSASSLALAEKWLINNVGLFNAAPLVTFVGTVVMWGVLWLRHLPVSPHSIFTKQMTYLIIMRTLATWAWVFALAAGALISIAIYISSLSIVIIAALGVLVMGESDYLKRKVLSVLLAVVGLSAILIGA